MDMFAVSAITKRGLIVMLATALFLHAAGDAAFARKKLNPIGFSTSLLEKMTIEKGPASSKEDEEAAGVTKIDVVGLLTLDGDGEKILMPHGVFCDPSVDEIYVIQSGRAIVFGENLFPSASLGLGRGAKGIVGGTVDKNGFIYVLEMRPAPFLAVYNSAFFRVKEFSLDQGQGVYGVPSTIALAENGNMYISLEGGRGAFVLDKDGVFLHWLKPMDLIFDKAAVNRSAEADELEEEAESAGLDSMSDEVEFDISELSPILQPEKQERVYREPVEPGLGPVQVNDVVIDSDGNIYLLSQETGKVYIYNAEEEFLYSFGEKGGSYGKLSQPRKMAIDEKKKAIYILDYNRHAILIYDLSGRFMYEFGGMGNGGGWFQYPNSIAVDNHGRVIVSDQYNHRAQVLDVHFEYKFPLFQVPFVYDPNEIIQPEVIQTTKHYGPGFDEGQAQIDLSPEEELIQFILEETGDII